MKNELATEKIMTTKEVAKALRCSERTIQRYARKMAFGQLLSESTGGRREMLFTEQEVTAMLNEMKKDKGNRSDLTTTVVVKSSETSNSVVARIADFASAINQTDLQAQLAMARAGMKALDNAMAILSAENVQLKTDKKQLQIELDSSKEWASVKRMESLNPNRKFDWRVLKTKSIELGVEIRKVFDANYGTVNAYHKTVWESCYELDEMPWE